MGARRSSGTLVVLAVSTRCPWPPGLVRAGLASRPPVASGPGQQRPRGAPPPRGGGCAAAAGGGGWTADGSGAPPPPLSLVQTLRWRAQALDDTARQVPAAAAVLSCRVDGRGVATMGEPEGEAG